MIPLIGVNVQGRAFFLVLMLCLSTSTGVLLESSDESALSAADGIYQSDSRSSTGTSGWSVSPSNGWTTGGEEIVITGSGFSDLAFSNTTDDGINHQWVETTMDYSDQAGRWNAVAVDSNGHIHVVQIKDDSYQIRHSVNDGTGWNTAVINTCGSTYCWDIHMVIDANDHIHLAYTTYTQWAETLVYMNYDGTTWTDTVVSSSAHFGPIGIAVDSSNNPHISYAANGADQCGAGLRISSYDGSSWSYTNVDQGANRGCESAIVIDESDHIYIAYQDRSSSKLKIATDKSGSWDSYLVDTGTTPSNLYPGYMTSMAVDQQGQFHIAHQDNKEYDLRYSTGAPNSQWTTTIVDATGHTGRDPSIAVDAGDQPHIVYHTWSGQNLKYATIDPVTSSWTVTAIANNADVGEGNSIFIDESGGIHVPFNDDTNDVLKYATKSTGLIQTMEITVQFGQYGSVTGTVVNDTTIVVTTPMAGQTADTVDITLMDKDGTSHTLPSAFTFISPEDLDSDGVLNADDDCPETAGDSTSGEVGCPDGDGDGFSDSTDSFPADASEWGDADGDGTGDNADAFPNDASETLDTDGDGVGDNSDAFPTDPNETLDSDGDGVGNLADAFPEDANETIDSDGDGVGDNADAFPNDANETTDTDGDGIGDNSDPNPTQHSDDDSDGDSIANIDDAFPNDATQWLDTDGDGYGDNASGNNPDAFVNLSTQWSDTDGDGYGDNWGDASWNSTRLFVWPGVFVDGATLGDHCPTEAGNSTVNGYFGCLDVDGDGIANVYDTDFGNNSGTTTNETNQTAPMDSDNDGVDDLYDLCPETVAFGFVDIDGCLIDEDGDGVDDFKDDCLGTASGATVDEKGCEDEFNQPRSFFESLSSGDQGAVIQTVGVGTILLALFGFLQTNMVAAMLPDSVRWIRVLRKDSNLNQEEIRELEYLKSLVQTYYQDLEVFDDELFQLKSELTARYTNSEIKKVTLEKINTLIADLLAMEPSDVSRIAHNDAYFGLGGAMDTNARAEYMSQDVLMREHDLQQPDLDAASAMQALSSLPPKNATGAISESDGYEYLEYPTGRGAWYYRNRAKHEWVEWEQ
ncbi:hypothetical protein N9A87_03440 [Euryarchaeota archaeon]|nr:hypothetical protein [Euryarchaeota archaeon]